MRLEELHSDILLKVVGELDQVADLSRLTSASRSLRGKLAAKTRVRLDVARRLYDSPNVRKNAALAWRDDQQHFMGKFSWLEDPNIKLAGLAAKGDEDGVRRLLKKMKKKIDWKLVLRNVRDVAMLTLLEETTFDSSGRVSHVAFYAGKTADKRYAAEAVGWASVRDPSTPMLCRFLCGAVKSGDASFVSWAIQEVIPAPIRRQLCSNEYLMCYHEAVKTVEVDRVLRTFGEVPLEKQVGHWFLCGDLQAIRAHPELAASCDETCLSGALRNGSDEVISEAKRRLPVGVWPEHPPTSYLLKHKHTYVLLSRKLERPADFLAAVQLLRYPLTAKEVVALLIWYRGDKYVSHQYHLARQYPVEAYEFWQRNPKFITLGKLVRYLRSTLGKKRWHRRAM